METLQRGRKGCVYKERSFMTREQCMGVSRSFYGAFICVPLSVAP